VTGFAREPECLRALRFLLDRGDPCMGMYVGGRGGTDARLLLFWFSYFREGETEKWGRGA
jgi:hypothetical protein